MVVKVSLVDLRYLYMVRVLLSCHKVFDFDDAISCVIVPFLIKIFYNYFLLC
jgi:hypothetical protein